MKKCLLYSRLSALLVCMFAAISVNAKAYVEGNIMYINGSSDIPTELSADYIDLRNGAQYSDVTEIKMTGDFSSGWSGGWLINGAESDPTRVATIDMSGVTGLGGSWGFKNFNNLKTIVWPDIDSFTTIPEQAFIGNTALESVEIPNTVTTIGKQAFRGCSSLASLTYEPTTKVQVFSEECFYGTALTSVTIPGSATEIQQDAFGRCTSLTSVTFAADCTSSLKVKFHAFDNSSNVLDVYILTTAHIKCENDAFEDDVTVAHGQVTAPKARLHFPEDEAAYYTNLGDPLDIQIAADAGRFQAWLVNHYKLAQTEAKDENNGWWEFVNTGGTPSEGEPNLGKNFLMTYSHPEYAHIVPDGVKAYIVNKIEKGTDGVWAATLKSISVIPPRTGVILYGETNSKNSDGNGTLSMSVITLAANVGGRLYRDGETGPSGKKVDLSLRRENWDGLSDFNLGDMLNFLEPSTIGDAQSTTLYAFEKDASGKVEYRNFGFSHLKNKNNKFMSESEKSRFSDFASFFRAANGSVIPSGKAYLRLKVYDASAEYKDPQLTGDELEIAILKDPNYTMRANWQEGGADIDEKTEGYWKLAVWENTDSKNFGVRPSDLGALKFDGEPIEDDVTGIETISTSATPENEVYYNLNGQRVENPVHGIFIKNGKKVILK